MSTPPAGQSPSSDAPAVCYECTSKCTYVCTLRMYVHYVCMYITYVCTLRMFVHYVCLYITSREQGQVGSRWPGIQYQDIHQLLSRSNPISCHQPAFIAASFIQIKGRHILCCSHISWSKFAETRNTLHVHSSIIEKKPDHKLAGDRNYCIRQRDNDGSLIVKRHPWFPWRSRGYDEP
jgi:hypothetical protein